MGGGGAYCCWCYCGMVVVVAVVVQRTCLGHVHPTAKDYDRRAGLTDAPSLMVGLVPGEL